jgi:hypothetical protein
MPFLAESFTTYQEIVHYLSNMNVVSVPELWTKHPKQHRLTEKGYKWELVNGIDPVGSFDLDVVNIANRTDYIVALVHEKTKGEEIPFPLGMKLL